MYAVASKHRHPPCFGGYLPQSTYASILAVIVIDFLVLIGSFCRYWRWCNHWRIVEGDWLFVYNEAWPEVEMGRGCGSDE